MGFNRVLVVLLGVLVEVVVTVFEQPWWGRTGCCFPINPGCRTGTTRPLNDMCPGGSNPRADQANVCPGSNSFAVSKSAGS